MLQPSPRVTVRGITIFFPAATTATQGARTKRLERAVTRRALSLSSNVCLNVHLKVRQWRLWRFPRSYTGTRSAARPTSTAHVKCRKNMWRFSNTSSLVCETKRDHSQLFARQAYGKKKNMMKSGHNCFWLAHSPTQEQRDHRVVEFTRSENVQNLPLISDSSGWNEVV